MHVRPSRISGNWTTSTGWKPYPKNWHHRKLMSCYRQSHHVPKSRLKSIMMSISIVWEKGQTKQGMEACCVNGNKGRRRRIKGGNQILNPHKMFWANLNLWVCAGADAWLGVQRSTFNPPAGGRGMMTTILIMIKRSRGGAPSCPAARESVDIAYKRMPSLLQTRSGANQSCRYQTARWMSTTTTKQRNLCEEVHEVMCDVCLTDFNTKRRYHYPTTLRTLVRNRWERDGSGQTELVEISTCLPQCFA